MLWANEKVCYELKSSKYDTVDMCLGGEEETTSFRVLGMDEDFRAPERGMMNYHTSTPSTKVIAFSSWFITSSRHPQLGLNYGDTIFLRGSFIEGDDNVDFIKGTFPAFRVNVLHKLLNLWSENKEEWTLHAE